MNQNECVENIGFPEVDLKIEKRKIDYSETIRVTIDDVYKAQPLGEKLRILLAYGLITEEDYHEFKLLALAL